MRQDITGKIVNIKPLHTVFTLMITDVGGKAATDFCPKKTHDHHGWESIWALPGARRLSRSRDRLVSCLVMNEHTCKMIPEPRNGIPFGSFERFSTATSQRLPMYKVCELGAARAAQGEASAFIHESRD